MTIRNLERLFKPSRVALIGASEKAMSVGLVAARNLLGAGFEGPIHLVNPRGGTIEGRPVVKSLNDLAEAPDLAVIATPPDSVQELITALGQKGTRAAVVFTAGFGEGGHEIGAKRRAAMLAAAKPFGLRIVGPNCFGVMAPRIGLNASFAHLSSLPGRLAFVTQSGAIMAAVVDWAFYRRIGFSHLVSLGDMADVDFGDMLDYLAADAQTRAVLLYIEAVTSPRKFMSAARAAARLKPVIVVKAGRNAEGAKAAASHTGAMAGSDAVYDAAFRRAGILRVNDLEALFDAVATLALIQPVEGERLAILTNGGGIGVLATDTLIAKQGRLAELSVQTMEKLHQVLPATWSNGNPVDIIGDAPPERYVAAFDILLADEGVDAVLVLNCPSAISVSTDAAKAIIAAAKQRTGRAARCGLLTCWMGGGPAEAARQLLRQEGIPAYETPTDAVRAFMQMVRYRRSQAELMEVPPSMPADFTPDTAAVHMIIAKVMAQGRDVLTETEAKAVLAAYQIPVVQTRKAASVREAADIAEAMALPVVLKILSPDITHKSDVGGVALNLQTADQVLARAEAMLEQVARSYPGARIEGFTVQPMVNRPGAHELIIGMTIDPIFGPVLLFGQGGTAVEVIADQSLALPPLNMALARDLMVHTRIYRLLKGFRHVPAADLEAIAFTLVKVSHLVCDLATIAELDINPLLADAYGVVAVDARIRVAPAGLPPIRRLAVCPYPKQLEKIFTLADGRTLMLRPIRPEDEPGFRGLFNALSPEQIRLRFLHPMKILPPVMAARMTQIDYDREMALVLVDPAATGPPRILGMVQIAADPDNEKAEFAIMLDPAMTGLGLGPLLLRRIVDTAGARGVGRLYGDVLSENRAMLELCKAMGFACRRDPEDPGVVLVTLDLPRREPPMA